MAGRGKAITRQQRVAVVGMKDSGLTNRDISAATGLTMASVWRIAKGAEPLDEDDLQAVKDRLRGRFLVATDTLLESALKGMEEETPYRRMIMAGIAHDHYLRTLLFEKGQSSQGILAQIIIMVDQRQRGQEAVALND